MEERAVPTHVGFIMDGNGRWAKQRNKPRSYGHKKGADILERLIQSCNEAGVKVVSLYAFSTENWSRPKEEVEYIFNILDKFLKKYLKELLKNRIRLIISGDISALPDNLNAKCVSCMEQTKGFTEKFLNIAINYGSRSEIVTAVNKLISEGKKEISEEDISSALYTKELPDIDLIVRTSGEQRLSNFFLWQSAYAELYFTETLWPDFDDEELRKALDWYANRKRKFGGIG